MKNKIVSTHIENNVVNGQPTVVYTDETGQEWVDSPRLTDQGGFISELKKKQKCWYFDSKNKS